MTMRRDTDTDSEPVPTPTPPPANRFEGDINRTAVGVPGTGDRDVTQVTDPVPEVP